MLTKPSPLTIERRNFQRVALSLEGRYMLANRQEYPCRTIDLSPGGIALAGPVRGAIDERAVLYLDHLGRLEGTITRYIKAGFVVVLRASDQKRDRLGDQLTWLSNRTALESDRRHERIVPNRRHCVLHVEDGPEHFVRILNVSVSGAAIATEVMLPPDTRVRLGATPGRVVRHLENGLVIAFDMPLPIDGLDENLTL